MLHEKKYFTIDLEDYGYPRHAAVTRCYCGTMEELIAFANRLDGGKWTAQRYRQIIEGIDNYDLDDEVTHQVAGKEMQLLTPVEVLALHETILENAKWNHVSYSGAVYATIAEKVSASQIVTRDQDGTLRRWIKMDFYEMYFCVQGHGWCHMRDLIGGFPGVITWDGETYHGKLYVQVASYTADQQEAAMAALHTVTEQDLSAGCQDVLGLG